MLAVTVASGALAVVMGIRFKKSGKVMPAGFMAGMRCESHPFRLLLKHNCVSLYHLFSPMQFIETHGHIVWFLHCTHSFQQKLLTDRVWLKCCKEWPIGDNPNNVTLSFQSLNGTTASAHDPGITWHAHSIQVWQKQQACLTLTILLSYIPQPCL